MEEVIRLRDEMIAQQAVMVEEGKKRQAAHDEYLAAALDARAPIINRFLAQTHRETMAIKETLRLAALTDDALKRVQGAAKN